MTGPEPSSTRETAQRPEGGNFPATGRVQSPDAVTPPDQHLISECLSGRPEAFGQLVVRYQDRLYHTLVGMLGSADDAHDAAQDAFVHAFSRLETFRGQSAFYSWLFRIAVNAAVSRKRKSRRSAASLDAAREQSGLEPIDGHPASEPSYAMEVSENQRLVRRALAELSDEFRTVLVLKELEDLKYEEIAEIMDCPVGTVRSRIHRARAELRKTLRILMKTDD
ncbi:MAG: sigma-70 family RNA polymerase sigma factor [Haloechinothrix sp.]